MSALRKLKAEVWIGSERVADVTTHPTLANFARSIASLYDMQIEHPEQMTYRAAEGGRIGYSFVQPRSVDELRKRGLMMYRWAEYSGGMIRGTPDFANALHAAMAGGRELFTGNEPRFGDNIARYHQEAARNDWCVSCALEDPAAKRPLELVEKTPDAIIVSGASKLAALAPFAEELLILPTPQCGAPPAALAFAIQCNAPGLRFVCSGPSAPSRADHLLASHFEEPECIAEFKDVPVPWERVFHCGDSARIDALFDATDARLAWMHQSAVSDLARCEFLTGLAARIAEPAGMMTLPSVRDGLARMTAVIDALRASLHVAEKDAAPNRWGVFTPARAPLDTAYSLFPQLYREFVKGFRSIEAPDSIDQISQDRGAADQKLAHAALSVAREVSSGEFARRHAIPDQCSFDASHQTKTLDIVNLRPLIEKADALLARL